MNANLLSEIKGQISGEIELFGGVEGHLLDEGEHHLNLDAYLKGKQFVVVLGKVEIKAGFGIKARSHDGFHNAGEHLGAAKDVVEVVLVGVVSDDFRKPCVIVEYLHIVGDADAECGTCGKGVVDLNSTPVGFQVDGTLVAVPSLQEEQGIQLPVADGAHVFVDCVDGPNRFGVFVGHQLHFPEVLVVEVRGTAVLKSDTETGRVREKLEIPVLGGHIVVIFPDILGIGHCESARQQQCKQELPNVLPTRICFPHGGRKLIHVVRIFSRHVVGVMAVSGATVLGVTC